MVATKAGRAKKMHLGTKSINIFLAFVNNFVSICRIATRLKLLVGLASKMDPVTASKGKTLMMEKYSLTKLCPCIQSVLS